MSLSSDRRCRAERCGQHLPATNHGTAQDVFKPRSLSRSTVSTNVLVMSIPRLVEPCGSFFQTLLQNPRIQRRVKKQSALSKPYGSSVVVSCRRTLQSDHPVAPNRFKSDEFSR